jgi:hypothetical protein
MTERDRRIAALRARLCEQLREASLPGEAEAAARSWPLVEAALADRVPTIGTRRRHPFLRVALAAALAAAALAAVLSPAGAAVGDWIGDRFAADTGDSPPAFAALPKGGPVLAISRTGAYAIRSNGNSRRLGAFAQAGWSPRGLHVVGAGGRRLTAMTPAGTVKWVLTRPGRVHDPAWSTGLGFAVAYLEGSAARPGGSALRVVDGRGNPATDRRLRRGAAAVTPAWLPRSDRLLTYARADGTLETLDVATRRGTWRSAPVASVKALAWSRDGRRLVALSPRFVTVLDADGHVLRTIALQGAGRELALHPSGRRAAVIVRRGAETSVVELRVDAGGSVDAPGTPAVASRRLFQGDVDGIAWSADGRRLLVGWRGAGEWLLLGPGERIRALHGVTSELGARGGFPRVAGWCCSR